MAAIELRNQIDRCGRAQWTLGVAGVVLAALFYFAGYWPQCAELKQLQQQIAAKQTELAINRAQANNLPRVTQEVSDLRTRLSNMKRLPAQPELDAFIRDVHGLSQLAQLRKFDFRPGAAKRTDLYCEQPISFTFEGDFLGVFTFIRRAEDMDRLTRIGGVTLHGIPTQPGEVTVELSMNLYYREAE
jgi:Tfp pilus assembly protein PilO